MNDSSNTNFHHKLGNFLQSDFFNKLSNALLAGFFFSFVLANVKIIRESGYKQSIMMLVIFNALLVYLFLTRKKPKNVSFHIVDIIITIVGTFILLFARGVGDSPDIPALQIVGTIGLFISIVGLLTLRKSFGLLPADRGIVSHGIYNIVRHPIYAGYVLHYACFLIQNYSPMNAALYIIFLVFEGYRLLREEKLLAQNPDYAAYMQRTTWRICPRIW